MGGRKCWKKSGHLFIGSFDRNPSEAGRNLFTLQRFTGVWQSYEMSYFLHTYKMKLKILPQKCVNRDRYVFAIKCGNPGLCAHNEVPPAPPKVPKMLS